MVCSVPSDPSPRITVLSLGRTFPFLSVILALRRLPSRSPGEPNSFRDVPGRSLPLSMSFSLYSFTCKTSVRFFSALRIVESNLGQSVNDLARDEIINRNPGTEKTTNIYIYSRYTERVYSELSVYTTPDTRNRRWDK